MFAIIARALLCTPFAVIFFDWWIECSTFVHNYSMHKHWIWLNLNFGSNAKKNFFLFCSALFSDYFMALQLFSSTLFLSIFRRRKNANRKTVRRVCPSASMGNFDRFKFFLSKLLAERLFRVEWPYAIALKRKDGEREWVSDWVKVCIW